MTPEERAALAQLVSHVDLSTFQPRPMPTGFLPAFHATNQQLLASLMRFMPPSYSQQPQGLPWWMQGGAAPVAARETPTQAVDSVWGPIEAEGNKETNIATQLGEFGRKVLNSPLTTGEW